MVVNKTIHTLSPLVDRGTIRNNIKTQFRSPIPSHINILDKPLDWNGFSRLLSFENTMLPPESKVCLFPIFRFIRKFSPFQLGEEILFKGKTKEEDILIKIKDIKIQKLFEIKRADIFREGFIGVKENLVPKVLTREELEERYYQDNVLDNWWINVWDSTVIEENHKWLNNPFVFVYEFEKTTPKV